MSSSNYSNYNIKNGFIYIIHYESFQFYGNNVFSRRIYEI